MINKSTDTDSLLIIYWYPERKSAFPVGRGAPQWTFNHEISTPTKIGPLSWPNRYFGHWGDPGEILDPGRGSEAGCITFAVQGEYTRQFSLQNDG